MKSLDIEEWAYRTISAIERRIQVEDDRVELKAHWPSPKDIARQLCGHANIARGEPILWLFGVDETKGVVRVKLADLASWRAQLEDEFESGAPRMQQLTLSRKDQSFAALLFETDSPPYVVRNPKRNEAGSGPFELEVSWRDGSRTRAARRAELILLLRPVARLPIIQPLSGDIRLMRDGMLHFNVYFYISTSDLSRIIIPKAEGSIDLGSATIPLSGFNVHPDGSDPDVIASRSHLTINGAGKVTCNGVASAPISLDYSQTARFEVRLYIASAGAEAVGRATLDRVGPEQNMYARWLLR